MICIIFHLNKYKNKTFSKKMDQKEKYMYVSDSENSRNALLD